MTKANNTLLSQIFMQFEHI